MKILMINGTMRRSSTYRIGKMFVERVSLPGDTVEELFLPKDMPEFCRGCGLCIMQGAKRCPDYVIYMRRITRMIDEADILVFTTPTFVYHATGQMKALLDHYGYRWMVHRPEKTMFTKQAVVFSTAAGAGMKSAISDITDSLKWWGVGRIYTYGVAVKSMDWDAVDKKIKDNIDKEVTKLMHITLNNRGKVTPSLRVKITFLVMRQMHKRGLMQPIDAEYWKEMGWSGKGRPWKIEKSGTEESVKENLQKFVMPKASEESPKVQPEPAEVKMTDEVQTVVSEQTDASGQTDDRAIEVKFYESIDDDLLKSAVIIAKLNHKWAFCKHKESDTYEIPGGHREEKETILDTAGRVLKEETGAVEFTVDPVCAYSVTEKTRVGESGNETSGMLYVADIEKIEAELHSEMERMVLFEEDEMPRDWTYPEIQPLLFEEYLRRSSLLKTPESES